MSVRIARTVREEMEADTGEGKGSTRVSVPQDSGSPAGRKRGDTLCGKCALPFILDATTTVLNTSRADPYRKISCGTSVNLNI